MHTKKEYTVGDIKNLLLPNHFEVGDYVLYQNDYSHTIFTYLILRINGDDYTIRYVSHTGQYIPDGITNKVVILKHTFMKKHFTKIKNYEKSKN